MFQYFKIKGESMLPTLQSGDIVITSDLVEINRNDIVVFNDATYGTVVKRVRSIKKNYLVFLKKRPKINESFNFSNNVSLQRC